MVYALVDQRDAWHQRVLAWWGRPQRPSVLLPASILPEVCYLLATRIGHAAEAAFVRSIADREFEIELYDDADIRRAADLMVTYGSLPLGFVDATIVALAERLGVTTIVTTDRRHFTVVRPRHAEGFDLAP